MQRKQLSGSYQEEPRPVMLARAIELVQAGRIQVDPLISHRFPFTEAKGAYDLLDDRRSEAVGVLLLWV